LTNLCNGCLCMLLGNVYWLLFFSCSFHSLSGCMLFSFIKFSRVFSSSFLHNFVMKNITNLWSLWMGPHQMMVLLAGVCWEVWGRATLRARVYLQVDSISWV
jgi:hypothetical protein